MAWPKVILVRGLQVPVESWDEFDELVQRYGGEALVVTTPSGAGDETRRERSERQENKLDPAYQALLQNFVEAGVRGVLTSHIGPLLGAKGKGVRPALERWSRQIGLVTGEGTAFAPVRRNDGRAYRLTEIHLSAARKMLGG